ncbi:MAG: SDR family NAD(P)-dependent oxidoreductase [Sandaracinaceae bacterium]
MTEKKQTPIAIVGLSCLFPGSSELTGFWQDILLGRDRLTRVPADRWLVEDYYDPDPKAPDKIYVDKGGFLDDVDFDPMKWGVPPSIVPATDSTQLLALVVAERTLRDAFDDAALAELRDTTSVILGVTSAQKLLGEMNSRLQRPVWVKALREMGLPEGQVEEACDRIVSHYADWQESTFPGILGNVVAGRIANRLDLGGTNCVTDAACASTFSALKMGVDELALHHSDVVLCGGADTMNDPFMFECFAKTTALSLTGDCRPFSDRADGTMLGEGVGMVALMRLEDAEARGVPVYAVIRGVGSSSDGRSKSVYAPVPEGQAKALRRAYDRAGYGPETVELIEAHGTGTIAGDAAEFEGLRQVFGDAKDAAPNGGVRWCALGSVKSQVGHTKAAAGAAGLIKAALAVRHGVLPPTIKVDAPNPGMDLEGGPFYLNTPSSSTAARPWIRGGDHPRRASVSSFGFGGSNFHVAIEEYAGPRPPRLASAGPELVTLSGDPKALLAEIDALLPGVKQPGMLRWLAWDSQRRFRPDAAARLTIVASDEEDLAGKLEMARPIVQRGEPFTAPGGVCFATGEAAGDVAFLFPGQGSQHLGMGAPLALRFEAARAVWDRAAGSGLHDVVFPRPRFGPNDDEDRLRATENAQPALGLTSLSFLEVLRALGLRAAMHGGHSFGEVSALHAAGVFGEEDFLRVARERGRLMAEAAASTDGAMLALSAEIAEVRALVEARGLEVTVANHNHPTQVVLSGTREAIEAAEAAAKEARLRGRRLDVATAFHSPVVGASRAPFAAFLSEVALGEASAPIYANATAEVYGDVRETLADQIAQPVRFVEQIEAMHAAGARVFVEVGAGSVLTGLVSRILKGKPHRAVALDRKGASDLGAFFAGLGQLAAAGVRLELPALWQDERVPVDPRAVERPRMTLSVGGANVGKPYPPAGGASALPPPNPAPSPRASSPGASSGAPVEPPRSSAPSAPTISQEALQVFLETQRQAAEAHATYQRSVADAHAAFLRSNEAAMNALARMLGGAPLEASVQTLPTAPVPVAASEPVPQQPAAPPPAAPQPVARHDGAPSRDLNALMLEVVAQKTGYPADMLRPSMELEADLGVDSIKRVEILAALRERAPELPELDPAKLGKLRTLAEITEVLQAGLGAAPAAPVTTTAPPRDLSALMLEVVAQKTGYPADMLRPSMELEADLGVDSIKRVEILAALRERAPELPELDPAMLGKLRTLAEITQVLQAEVGAAPTESSPASPPASPERDLSALMLEVVAQKTGYPADMLRPSMELEADLGVDSIKRVEILAALRERAPELPELDPAKLGKLRTLAEITQVLEGAAPTAPPAPNTSQPIATAPRRFAIEWLDAPAPGLAPPGLFAGPVGVFGDPALVEALRAHGLDARADEPCRALVHVGEDPAEAFRFARTHATRCDLLIFVSRRDHGAAGLARTVQLEHPDLVARSITGDVDPARVADEIVSGGVLREVRLDAARRVPRVVRAPEPRASACVMPPVVVASGGGRGVTAACLITLAEEVGGRYLLLGRTALAEEDESTGAVPDAELENALMARARARGETPTPRALRGEARRLRAAREVRATLDAIHAAGGEARYAAADVGAPETIRAALEDARAAFGPFTMVVHGAGVLADKHLVDKSDDDFARVYGTKVDGARALLDALSDDPIASVMLFGSVAARFGNVGQSDYAMANAALDALALEERARRPDARVRCIAWGPWAGGMVTPALAAHFAEKGIPLIDLAEGAHAFVREARGEVAEPPLVVLGAPLARSSEHAARFSFRVSRHTHPELLDHAVKDVPVLPVVLVLEHFARAAKALRPDLAMARCRDVKVLRGVPLTRFDEGHVFEIALKLLSNGHGATYSAELSSQDGVHYRAQLDLVAELPMGSTPRPAPADMSARPGPLYGGCLFHGARFQVIRALDGVGEGGAAGTLVGTPAVGWLERAWQVDPALLDGGLQLAVLWTERRLGGDALPTGLEALHVYRPGPIDGEVRALVHGHDAASGRARCDVTFVGEDGSPLAELRGVETHVLPR